MHDGPVTTPWAPPAQAAAAGGPPLRDDAVAGGLTGVALVLLGAPVGLLWAAVAPRVRVVLGEGGPGLADPETGAFVGADLAFGALVLVVGLVCGAVAYRFGRGHGPAVVLGLVVGGLAAAYVAAKTGEQVGLEGFRAAVEDTARRGTVEATVRLRATEAVVLWPVGALAAFGAATAVLTPPEPPGPGVSSG